LLDEVFDTINIDRKMLRSFIPFIVKPGFLAKEHIEGRRKSYTSPMRLYLLMSLVFFFLAQISSNKAIRNSENRAFKISSDTIDGLVMDESKAIEMLKKDSLILSEEDIAAGKSGIRIAKREYQLSQSIVKAFTEKDFFIQSLYKNISYILFILMPAFALLLKLLYVRRRRFYIEHLVFALNMHSFSLLLFSIMVILVLIFPSGGSVVSLLFLILPIYYGVGMKRFYKQGWAKTIVKEVILSFLYMILLISSGIIVIILTLYTL